MNYLDMLVKLNFTNSFKKLSHTIMVGTPQTLEVQMLLEQNRAQYLLHANRAKDEDTYLSDLLIQLDFMTYVPFGQRGRKQIERSLNIDFTDYKYSKMIQVLQSNNIEIDFLLNKSIKKYCEYLTVSKQDLSKPESVAATIRQIGGEIENKALAGIDPTFKGRSDQLREIVGKIYDQTEKTGLEIDLKNYITPDKSELSEKEVLYFNNITEIKFKTAEKEL